MLDAINALACAAMLALLLPVAKTMNPDGHWPQRVAFTVVAVVFGLQAFGPFTDWLPEATWLQAVFNVILAFVVLNARREIMFMVRATVGSPPPPERAEAPAAMPEHHLAGVNGGHSTNGGST